MSAETDSPNLKRLAKNLWEYEPTAVLWEPDGSLRAYKGAALRSAMATAQADDRAPVALYDAFRTSDNQRVMAIQALEEESYPRDLQFYYGDELKATSRIMLDSNTVPCPAPCAIQQIQAGASSEAPLRITVEASSHSAEIDIPPFPFADWRDVTLTQVLVQKDYPMVWIRDHALLYHRAHGYERMVVYDNGSSNIAELKDCLAQLDEGLQVLLIRWPFPMHRPRIRCKVDPDTYAQVAAFNHHLHLLASRSTYISHFDLDEYLLNRSGKPLAEYLNTYLADKIKDALPVWTERVANVTKQVRSGPVRAANFRWQSRNSAQRIEQRYYCYKMIYRAKPDLFVQIHRIAPLIPDSGIQSSEVQDSKIRNSDIKERPLLRRVIRHTLLKLHLWDGIVSCLIFIQDQLWQIKQSQIKREQSRRMKRGLILFHYDGIRTDWIDSFPSASNIYRIQRLPWNPLRHKRNDEMPKLLKRIGLADEDD